MLVGFDTEYTFRRVQEMGRRLHGDIATMQPVCACLYFESGTEVRFCDRWERLQDFFADPQFTFVVHGCHAEALFCEQVGVRFPEKFIDTLLMSVMVLHAKGFRLPGGVYKQAALANIATRYGIPLLWENEKDAIRDSIMRGTHVQDFGMDRVMDYCLEDARAVVHLCNLVREDMRKSCGPHAEKNFTQLYQPYALVMAAAARKGIRFDTAGWDQLLELAPRYRNRLLRTMRNFGYDHEGQGIGDTAFRRMIRTLGLERTWPKTATGQLSTKEDHLKAFRHQHGAILAVHKLTKFDAFMTQDYGARVDSDGKLRCGILPLAQRSSRNSTTSPNLKGIPGELRPLLLPDKGCAFVHFDFSQQEPGVAGFLSGDRALMDDFANGDVYINLGKRMGLILPDMTAAEIKAIRKKVLKSLMLAILYGKSARSIATDVPCSYGEAVMHLSNFSSTYHRRFAWLRNYVATSLQRGWAENVIGFRAAFNVIDPRERNHIARSCQNFPVQSSAAACFQVTGLFLADFGADIRLPLHDAYLLNVPKDPAALGAAKAQIHAATIHASSLIFPGLAVKQEIEVLDRFAKDGEQNSFTNWVRTLQEELCGVQ